MAAESFEGNGDYSYNEETDFKRKADGAGESSEEVDPEVKKMADKANDYIRDCLLEKSKLEKNFPIAERLLKVEIEKVQTTGRIPGRERKADIYREKPIRVAQKVLVPVREHPKFNFVGKLLGPKGNSLRRLQEDTLCKMTVLGRNSMKDRAKEEELRASLDPKYAHLNDDLHVEISTIAPPAEAHARIAYAMAELRKYLIPDSNDIIRQEQLRELMVENPNAIIPPSIDHEQKSTPPYKRTPTVGRPSYAGGYRPPAPGSSHPPTAARTVMAPKQKILSILERARTAMDESHTHNRYEEPAYESPAYDGYPYAPHGPQTSRTPYDAPEYETGEYRRDYYPHSPGYPPVKASSAASARPSWKGSPGGANYHSSSSSSRRHDDHDLPPTSASSSAKHTHSSREARYKSAPYPRPK